MVKPTVNIGCGYDQWGDFRLDINPHDSKTIKCDIEKPLPFPDKFFSESRLYHVLEHCDNPQNVLNEAIRVSDLVNAKFPAKYDILPWGISDMLCPLSRESLSRLFAWFLHRLRKDSHPMKHHWVCQPFGRYKLNMVNIPVAFTYGRKSKYLKCLTIKFPTEWECWYP